MGVDLSSEWLQIFCRKCFEISGIFFCIILTDSGIEGATSPPLGKDHIPSSPMTDRKKKKRNRSINLKGDAAAGQADGKRSDL